ncbi:transcription initiation factor IIB [Trapelia coarctata]|nr:transcription initiation factor IIB [Trapelia coarctata]
MATVPVKPEQPDEEPWQENLNTQMICHHCKETPPNLVEEFSSGDMVCGSCGTVLGDRIVDTRSEWRTFSNDDQNNDDPSRVGDGANPLLDGPQLATSIAFGDGGGRARDLHRAQNKANHDKTTKTLLAAYKEIGTLCDAWHITKNVSDTAKHLFKMVHDGGSFKAKAQEVIIAGCIFIACRQCGVPRTFREVFALTKVSKKEIGRIFKSLERFFAAQNLLKEKEMVKAGVNVNPNDTYNTTTSTKAQELCSRYCNQLGLSPKVSIISQSLADKMSTVGALAGRSPLSAAAACIYFVSHLMGYPRTAKEISAVAGVSDGTIRTSYKFLEKEKDKLIDPEWLKIEKASIDNLPKP